MLFSGKSVYPARFGAACSSLCVRVSTGNVGLSLTSHCPSSSDDKARIEAAAAGFRRIGTVWNPPTVVPFSPRLWNPPPLRFVSFHLPENEKSAFLMNALPQVYWRGGRGTTWDETKEAQLQETVSAANVIISHANANFCGFLAQGIRLYQDLVNRLQVRCCTHTQAFNLVRTECRATNAPVPCMD